MAEEDAHAQHGPKPLTEEQLAKLRRLRWFVLVWRLLWSLLFLSLFAGGPHKFFVTLPGQVFSAVFFLAMLVDVGSQTVEVRGKRLDRGSFFILRGATYTMYSLCILDHFVLTPRWSLLSAWVQWSWIWLAAGAALAVLGQVLRVTAIRTLGRFFTYGVRVQQDQKVIQHGVYAAVRHPAYTGFLLTCLGYTVLFASAFGLAAWLLLVLPALLNRIAVEEKALIQGLGSEYREYKKRVKALIPFLL